MNEDDRFNASRRRVLLGSAALGTVGLAGCADEDEPDPGVEDDSAGMDDSDDGTADPAPASVTLLVEGVGGGGHDHDHDDDHHDGELSGDEIDHACGHLEFDELEELAGGASADDAPTISSTHQPYDVTFEGDSAFVVFEADGDDDHDHDDDHHDDDHHDDHDHDDDHHDDDHHDDHDHDDDHHDDDHHDDHDHGDGDTFAFFTTGGTATVHEGHVRHEADAVDACAEIDRYVVAEADHGRVVVELTPDE